MYMLVPVKARSLELELTVVSPKWMLGTKSTYSYPLTHLLSSPTRWHFDQELGLSGKQSFRMGSNLRMGGKPVTGTRL